jgi:acyl-coenzyme A synthetase/AMP-(fatty) acid ligase
MWRLGEHRSKTAVITEQSELISYAALSDAADTLAEQIPTRCLIFCLCANELGALIGYLACLRRQIVPFLGEATLDKQLLANLRATYKPDYIWCPSNLAAEFADSQNVYTTHGYSLLKTADTGVYPLHPDLALLLTTSGSTGSPKLVRQSYRNLQANTAAIVDYLGLDNNERPITTLPMSYTYGLSIINSHLAVGATLILTNQTLMQREFWQLFKANQATSFGGVPYTYEMLDKLRFFRMDLPSLRTMTQAGGRLAPELQCKFAEYAEQKGLAFIVMYGQTEATARISYLPAAEAARHCGSIGRAIPGGRLWLVGEDGNPIDASDTVGELLYEGENVTLGYAETGTDLGKGDELHGVLRTGDLARRDADGYYYIVGRTKRFLKIFGNRINLDEVEGLLRRAFPGIDCACGGRDDKLQVFLVRPAEPTDIRLYLSDKLGIHFSGFQVQLVDGIPRTSAGKILYQELDRVASEPSRT